MDGSTTPSRVVYRALLGGYEELRDEPIAKASDIDWVCFTDDSALTSETWRMVVVEPRFPADHIRSARHLKIVGHPLLETYDESLWVDNTVELLVTPEEILDAWLADADLALPLHSHSPSVLAEAEAILNGGRDDFVRVYEQMSTYLRHQPERAEANPHWTGMIARRHGHAVREAMSTWWEHVLRFSHRDQLSFSVAVPRDGLRLHSVDLDHHSSPVHLWPRATGRRTDRPGPRLRQALRPPAVENEFLRARLATTQAELDAERAATRAEEHDDLVAALGRVRQLETEVAVLHGRLQEATTLVDRLLRRVGRLRAKLARLSDGKRAD